MMSGVVGFSLLFFSVTPLARGSVVSRHYTYIFNPYTWQEAQSYCRSYYNDLALVHTQADVDGMFMQGYHVWLGLYKDTTGSWKWSDGESLEGDYVVSDWARNEPHHSDACAFVNYRDKKVYGSRCDDYCFFICYELRPNNYKYMFIPQSKTWSEAQEYCRSLHEDLATIPDHIDLHSLIESKDFPVWTGLHKDGMTWQWAGGSSAYRQWAAGEPTNTGNCAAIYSVSKEMSSRSCSARFPFVCFRDNLILVKENKTWEEALDHCRSLASSDHSSFFYSYDLVSMQPGEDQSYVTGRMQEGVTEKVWTGLRFLAGHWLWVNGAVMLYPDLPLCPPKGQRCGALSKNETGRLELQDCNDKLNFMCYRKW